MPWCPKCNMEYQEGITVCSDCKVDLVQSLEEEVALIPFLQADDRKIADKLARFFEYSNIKSEVSFDEENEVYVVSIPPKKDVEAKKLYQAFYYVERDNYAKEEMHKVTEQKVSLEGQETPSKNTEASLDSSENDFDDSIYENEEDSKRSEEDYDAEIPDDVTGIEDVEDTSRAYVMKADQYKDLASSVWIFLFFGVVGFAFVMLNVVGILTFLNGVIPNTVMGALFLLFIYIALSTNKKAKKIRSEIDTENKLTEEINKWLNLNVTKSFLSSIYNENFSEELNYLKQTDVIKELLIKEFGAQNLAYLDRLIEEFYVNVIDKDVE